MQNSRSRQTSSQFIFLAGKEPSVSRFVYDKICQLLEKLQKLQQLRNKTLKDDRNREETSRCCKLLSYEEAPAYLKRPFIKSGYLVGGTSSEAAWQTGFGLNNETLNAWTMVPACICATIGLMYARRDMPSEVLVFWLFLLSSIPHAPFAMRLHLTVGTSLEARNLWRTLDVFFIFTCAVPRAAALGWYVFQDPQHYSLYISVTLTVYLLSIYNCMVRRRIKDIPKTALPKALASAILCYSIPGLLAAYRELTSVGYGPISQLYTLIMICITAGGLGYGCKVPERWSPGTFDLIGNGHQVMHVAAFLEYTLELCVMWILARQKVGLP